MGKCKASEDVTNVLEFSPTEESKKKESIKRKSLVIEDQADIVR